jgi:hypothetical protein
MVNTRGYGYLNAQVVATLAAATSTADLMPTEVSASLGYVNVLYVVNKSPVDIKVQLSGADTPRFLVVVSGNAATETQTRFKQVIITNLSATTATGSNNVYLHVQKQIDDVEKLEMGVLLR